LLRDVMKYAESVKPDIFGKDYRIYSGIPTAETGISPILSANADLLKKVLTKRRGISTSTTSSKHTDKHSSR